MRSYHRLKITPRDVFDRYDIVSQDDLKDAALKRHQYTVACPPKTDPRLKLVSEAGPRQVQGCRLALGENGGGNIAFEEASMTIHVLERMNGK